MPKYGKRYRAAFELASNAGTVKDLAAAVKLVKETARAKFDETIVVSSHLGVDPRHSDQLVRGTVVLPHGTGKSLRVLVLAKGEKAKEALDAGADFAGTDEYVKKIQDGWLEIDAIVATPDMMGEVGKLGRVLGPRGLMPNPKVGTVTPDVAGAVKNAKAGQVRYRCDKAGIVHCQVGRASFEGGKLKENLQALLADLQKMKPASSKGIYIQKVTISSTMGPGVTIERSTLGV